MNTVCILGGSGFIGTRLVRRLSADPQCTAIIFDKAPSRAYPDLVTLGDVRSVDQIRGAVPERSAIVNLAAEHRDDVRPVSLYDEVNVGGARNICTVAREKDVRTIVFTSSVAVYGFAEVGTGEAGMIAPYNNYGRTKHEAELVFREWQTEAPQDRTLVIVRPTVVFGEQNRGNVYNLLREIASGRFVMVGDGENRKSLAYVENVAAFIEYSLGLKPGVHIYNYVDKPDYKMKHLVADVNRMLGRPGKVSFKLPFVLGLSIGKFFDFVAAITGKRSAISSIRVRKFCSNSVYDTAVDETEFIAPVSLAEALSRTVRHEFIETHEREVVFYAE